MASRLVLGAALLLCAGCGHLVDVNGDRAKLQQAPSNTTTAQLTYDKLAIPSDVTFWIDEKSPVVEFGAAGKSYAKGFELPEVEAYRLTVRSYSLLSGPIEGAIFYPVLLFLDPEKKVVEVSSRGWTLTQGTFAEDLNAAFRLQYVEHITSERPWRYIVIRSRGEPSSPGAAAGRQPIEIAASAPYPASSAESEQDEASVVRSSPVGYIEVKVDMEVP
jgi:hypothetical protein